MCECRKGEVVGWYCSIEVLRGRREKISDFSYVEKWEEHEDGEDSFGRDACTTVISKYMSFGTADSHSLDEPWHPIFLCLFDLCRSKLVGWIEFGWAERDDCYVLDWVLREVLVDLVEGYGVYLLCYFVECSRVALVVVVMRE